MSTATSTTSHTRNAGNESDLCQFPFQDGRRCRMLHNPEHSCLSIFHARAESQLFETERLGVELGETLSGDFMSATDINHAMGRLYIAIAQDRIPIRNANTLARIGGTPFRQRRQNRIHFQVRLRSMEKDGARRPATLHSRRSGVRHRVLIPRLGLCQPADLHRLRRRAVRQCNSTRCHVRRSGRVKYHVERNQDGR